MRKIFRCIASAALFLPLASFLSLGSSSARAADAALIEAAKKEGQVVWYTTLLINQLGGPLAEAFEKKYGIKVLVTRNDPEETALRIFNESRAGAVQADVFDGSFASTTFVREGILAKYRPESAKDFPKNLLDPNGYWTANRWTFTTPGVNTSLIPPGTEPKTWDDLLAPQWRGKMAWGTNPGATGAIAFIGLVLTELGEEKGDAYLRRLQNQNITGLKVSARAVLDQVIAGEYPMALGILNDNAVFSRNQGAPVAWLPMSPALGALGVISVVEKARHPNAARLLADFVVSEEGQVIARNRNYIPVHPKVAPLDPDLRPDGGKFRAVTLTPEQLEEGKPNWVAKFNEVFR
jgi:iron(III) transport system substrate-binding protein